MLLLITSCIAPSPQPFLKVLDNQVRLNQTIGSLRFFVQSGCFDKIVICDSSSYQMNIDDVVDQSTSRQVCVEVLAFQGNTEMVRKLGKGYGEGEIMEYVLKNSRLMAGETYFFKVTGRLTVTNLRDIMPHLRPETNYFNITVLKWLGAIDTRFYGVCVSTYRDDLLHAYRNVNDSEAKYYEICFRDMLLSKAVHFRCFPRFPIICGTSGTQGLDYSNKGLLFQYQRFTSILGVHNTRLNAFIMLALDIPRLLWRRLRRAFLSNWRKRLVQ